MKSLVSLMHQKRAFDAAYKVYCKSCSGINDDQLTSNDFSTKQDYLKCRGIFFNPNIKAPKDANLLHSFLMMGPNWNDIRTTFAFKFLVERFYAVHKVVDLAYDRVNTPLIIAAYSCQYLAVKILLESGRADPNQKNEEEFAPLIYALNSKCQDNALKKATIKTLLKAGAQSKSFKRPLSEEQMKVLKEAKQELNEEMQEAYCLIQ